MTSFSSTSSTTTMSSTPQHHKPSSMCNRQTSWRLRIATVIFLASAAFALQCHNHKVACSTIVDNNSDSNNNNKNIRSYELLHNSEQQLNLPPKLSNDVRGLIRTIRVALPPDRDSIQFSPSSDGPNQVTIHQINAFSFSLTKFGLHVTLINLN